MTTSAPCPQLVRLVFFFQRAKLSFDTPRLQIEIIRLSHDAGKGIAQTPSNARLTEDRGL